jgi:hypothetical protein
MEIRPAGSPNTDMIIGPLASHQLVNPMIPMRHKTEDLPLSTDQAKPLYPNYPPFRTPIS